MQFLERIYFWENTQKRYNYVPFIENSEKSQFYENSMPGRPTYFPTGWEVWLNPPPTSTPMCGLNQVMTLFNLKKHF